MMSPKPSIKSGSQVPDNSRFENSYWLSLKTDGLGTQ